MHKRAWKELKLDPEQLQSLRANPGPWMGYWERISNPTDGAYREYFVNMKRNFPWIHS